MWSPDQQVTPRWVCPSIIQTDIVWRFSSSHQPWLYNRLQVQWLKLTAWICLEVLQVDVNCDSIMIVSLHLQTAGVCWFLVCQVQHSARGVQASPSLFSITVCIVRYVHGCLLGSVGGRQVRVSSVMLWMKRPWTLHGRGIPSFSWITLPTPQCSGILWETWQRPQGGASRFPRSQFAEHCWNFLEAPPHRVQDTDTILGTQFCVLVFVYQIILTFEVGASVSGFWMCYWMLQENSHCDGVHMSAYN